MTLFVGGFQQEWYFDLAEADNPFWMPPLVGGLTADDTEVYLSITNTSVDDVDIATAVVWMQELNAPA